MRPLVALFAFATAARLLFLFGVDQPLLYTHQYTYFTNAMRIAEHPSALAYIVTSEEWRTWDGVWTIAPLYFVFLGLLLKIVGLHLWPIQILQCAIGGATAAGVAALGRDLAGRAGLLAGIVYAIYGPAVEITSTTMTENLHTPLLVFGLLAATRATERVGKAAPFAAGALIGLSALTRSVSTGFLGMAALLALLRHRRQGVVPAVFLLAGGAAVVLPWTARNVFVVHDAVLIESAAFENLWYANSLEDRVRRERQLAMIHEQPTPGERRRVALHFALRGIRRNPGAFVDKVRTNFWHFFRPEGLYNLLRIERSQEAWRHAMSLLQDDLLLLAALPLFGVFVLAGRASPTRTLLLLWVGYYLFMLVVVFHNEIRYRSGFVPFLFPGAIAGVAVWRAHERRARTWIGAAIGLWIVAMEVGPFVAPAWRALHADAPTSPRPWLTKGRDLAARDDLAGALDAYDRAAVLSTPANWTARLARPHLLRELGRPADEARAAAHAISWNEDPWLALEVAWRALPAPRGNEIRVGDDDYGAVRGFLYPRGVDASLEERRGEWNRYERLGDELPPAGHHRWSRHRAWLRLRPTTTAAQYTATLWMSVAFPSTRTTSDVAVHAGSGAQHFTVDHEIRPHSFTARPQADGTILVRLDAPTWCRAGEPADQGVRVDRLTVEPDASAK